MLLFLKAKKPGIGDRMGDFFGDAPAPALVQKPVQVRGYTRSDGTPVTGHTEFRKVRPEETKPAINPAAVKFNDLHPKAQDLFNTAWYGKLHGRMVALLDPANKGLRAEFELRSGIKLPRTIKGTDEAVSAWAAVPWSEEKTNTPIPKDPDEKYPALAQARKHARAMRAELDGMDKEWHDIYRENFVWIIEGKTIHLRPGAPGELVDRFNRYRADRKRIAKQYAAAMKSVNNLGGWIVKLKDDPVATMPAPSLSEKTLEPAVESVPEPEPAAAAEAAKTAAANASATPPLPKRTEKRIVTIVSKPQKPGSSAMGYEFGITGGARQPSVPSELAPYDERNFGFTMKMRMAGRDWEPEDYGWAPNAKHLLERIASGLSSAGPVDESDVVHPELLPLVQAHHAEVQAREDAAKAEQDKADAEYRRQAQLQADVVARMATVKRKKGKADIALSNGVTVHVTGWQHGDYLAHKNLVSPARKGDPQGYQVTHVPSGKSLTSNLPTMESARELAYRAHLTGAKWDGTEKGAKGAFRDALVSAMDGYRERAPIPPDPDAVATKP